MNCSLEHLGQVDFDMLTRPFKMELKVQYMDNVPVRYIGIRV